MGQGSANFFKIGPRCREENKKMTMWVLQSTASSTNSQILLWSCLSVSY